MFQFHRLEIQRKAYFSNLIPELKKISDLGFSLMQDILFNLTNSPSKLSLLLDEKWSLQWNNGKKSEVLLSQGNASHSLMHSSFTEVK